MAPEWYDLLQGYNLMIRSNDDRLYAIMIFVLFVFPLFSSLVMLLLKIYRENNIIRAKYLPFHITDMKFWERKEFFKNRKNFSISSPSLGAIKSFEKKGTM